MPHNAIATGAADYVLEPSAMAKRLISANAQRSELFEKDNIILETFARIKLDFSSKKRY
jgi:hypothetical protein